ncbi:MAG: hypothetical protein AAFS10_08240, partial [Myxococcota bacterium]
MMKVYDTFKMAPTALMRLGTCTPVAAMELFEMIQAALPTCNDPDHLEAMAQALPETVSELAPEVSREAQRLAVMLAPYGPRLPCDVDTLPPYLATLWRRAQLAVDGGADVEAWDETQLSRVVVGMSMGDVAHPNTLLERLARARDVRLRHYVVDTLPGAVSRLAVRPEDAFGILEPLLADEDAVLRRNAIRLLSEPWLRELDPAATHRRETLLRATWVTVDTPEMVFTAALDVATDLDERAWMMEVAQGEHQPMQRRADAVRRLGNVIQEEDLAWLLEWLEREPLGFGSVVRHVLLEAHRRGVFLREPHLEAALHGFDQHTGWTADAFIRVTHTIRRALVKHLAALPSEDPRWTRRAQLLAASVGTGAAEVLHRLLGEAQTVETASAFIRAAGRSPEFVGEEALLRWLEAAPEEVLPVLRVKGGPASVKRLKTFVLEPLRSSKLRQLGLEVLWAWAEDRGPLMELLVERLGPHASGLLGGIYGHPRDTQVAKLLMSHQPPFQDGITDIERLQILCASGARPFLPDITRLFRRLVRSYVQAALAGDFTIKRLKMPELEQMVFRYGRFLVEDGRTVRPWLEETPATGRDLLLRMAVEWLLEAPAHAVSVALLELIGRHNPGGAYMRFIMPFWRHSNREVRRAALEALLEAGEQVRGLELSMCRLVDDPDPRIATQALTAVTVLGAHWAERSVLAALERPEMGVKKEAARALAQIGTHLAVPPLVRLLSVYDNTFRSYLHDALRHCAGTSWQAVVLAALRHPLEKRSIALLQKTLSGHLTCEAALRLGRSNQPEDRALIESCIQGHVRLADATPTQLARLLYRGRLSPTPPSEPDPVEQLQHNGFSPSRAKQLAAEHAHPPPKRVQEVVRHGLVDWLRWLSSATPGHHTKAVTLVLYSAAHPNCAPHAEALLELAERERDSLEPEAFATWLESLPLTSAALKFRAVTFLRTLNTASNQPRMDGLRCYRLLGQLNAVRDISDMQACLDACRTRPNFASRSAQLITEAFAIPPKHPNEPDTVTAMRTWAERWFRISEPERSIGLARLYDTRPLELPPPPPMPPLAHNAPAVPCMESDLEALRKALHQEVPFQERQRAITLLLDWKDARDAHTEVLEAYLKGQVDLDRKQKAVVAGLLKRWPED